MEVRYVNWPDHHRSRDDICPGDQHPASRRHALSSVTDLRPKRLLSIRFLQYTGISHRNSRQRQWYNEIMTLNTQNAILERLIESERDELSEEAARYFLAVDFKPKDLARMEELAALAR